jgi:hypothetical protein
VALTELVVVNMALARLGVEWALTSTDDTAANIVETSVEARNAKLWWERSRNALLSDSDWSFARKYALLDLDSDGTGEVWESEWGFTYELPDDLLVLRRFLSGVVIDPATPPFEIGFNGTLRVVYTDVEPDENDQAKVLYTFIQDDMALWSEMAGSALAWRLAFDLCMPLNAKADLQQRCMAAYRIESSEALANASNEGQDRETPDGPLLGAR